MANAISANGLIVGMSKVLVGSSQVWRAVVSSDAGNPGSLPLIDLNTITYVANGNTATSAGWTLTSAERINRVGWIVGYGTKSGQTRAFVLSPR